MARSGKQKNTKNKKKHTQLMDRKKTKLRSSKDTRAAKLKEVVAALKSQRESSSAADKTK